MGTRSGPDYPPGPLAQFAAVRDAGGEDVSTGRLPVVNIGGAAELGSMPSIIAPGIQHWRRAARLVTG